MANGLLDNYLLPPEVQRDANIRGILGTLIGIGQASGPSPVPVGPGTIASSGAAAGLKAMDDYEQGQFKKAYIGAQVSKLKEATEQKQRVLQYAQSLPPGEERDRLMLEIQGINSNRIKGDRPWYAISPENAQTAAQFEGLKSYFGGMGGIVPETIKSSLQTRIVPGADGRIQGFGPNYQGGAGAIMEGLGLPGLLSGGLPSPSGSAMRPPPVNIPQQPSPLAMADTAGPANASAGVQMAQAQGGFRPGGTQLAPPTVSPGMLFQQQKAGETERAKVIGGEKGEASFYTRAVGEFQKAGELRNALIQMETAVAQGLQTGAGADVLSGLANVAVRLGADEKKIAELTKVAPGDARAFESAAKGLVFAALGGLGAQISNTDRDFIEAIFPRLKDSPEAVKQMMGWLHAKADYAERKFEGMQEWVDQGKSPATFELKWRKDNPPPLPPGISAPRGKEEYDTLPSGSLFLDPNKRIRVKP